MHFTHTISKKKKKDMDTEAQLSTCGILLASFSTSFFSSQKVLFPGSIQQFYFSKKKKKGSSWEQLPFCNQRFLIVADDEILFAHIIFFLYLEWV